MKEAGAVDQATAGRQLMLFAIDGSRAFGEQVSARLGIALSSHEEREFEDGEHKTRPLVSVRDRDVFILYSLYADQRQSGNDKLCRLLFFIGALKDAAAARVTAVVPYLAYARKDRKSKPRDPVTTRYVAALFEAVGTDAVLTMDVHNLAAYQNAFRCRTEHLEANGLFVAHFAPLLQQRAVIVVAPDAGGIKRADQFRQRLTQALGKPVGAAFAEKYRSGDVVSGDMLVGEVDGKDALIIDDLISSGTTLARTAKACRARGAARVFAAATHGLFMGDAETILAEPALERIVVTDTVPPFRIEHGALKHKVDVLDSAALFADAIDRLHSGGSITGLLASE
jgi:ribose-phosphate pyrophosphokinase